MSPACCLAAIQNPQRSIASTFPVQRKAFAQKSSATRLRISWLQDIYWTCGRQLETPHRQGETPARHTGKMPVLRKLDEFRASCDVETSIQMEIEYTDAPTQAEEIGTDQMQCPYCGAILPKDAEACTQCDWTREATKPAEPKASDAMAILLSTIPGLGHIYKGHRVIGALLMLFVTPVAIAFGFLAAFASAGFGLGILVFYWIGVMIHAWAIEDRIVPTADAGEEY